MSSDETQTPLYACLTILCGVMLALPALAGEPVAPDDVEGPFVWGSAKNVTRLDHLWFADQPDAAGFSAARDAGVSIVIDLRDPSERDGEWSAEDVIEAKGLTYYNVPVSGERFDPEAFARIDALIEENEDQQILVHCSSSNRAGAWLATHLVAQHGMTEEDALSVGRRAGVTKAGIEDRVREYWVGQRARRALAPLKKELMTTLKGAMAVSPTAALQTCQLAAPVITEGAQSPVVAVGRTSHHTRNPANDPESWMRPLLEHYLASPMERLPPQVVDLGERGSGYVEPIYLQQMCTTCHGVAIDTDLLSQIRKLYPRDRAVGFAPGELRGLFWVVMAPQS